MTENNIIKLAAYGFVGLVVVPTAIGMIGGTLVAVSKGVSKLAYDRKIKKGLKNGSIMEIDGQYYEVVVEGP